VREAAKMYGRSRSPARLRTADEVRGLFAGLTLVDPGVVVVSRCLRLPSARIAHRFTPGPPPRPAPPDLSSIDPRLDLEDEIVRLKKEKSAVLKGASPNCAPVTEYVEMPEGSSSAAPVIRPGPRLAKNCRSKKLLLLESDAGFGEFMRGQAVIPVYAESCAQAARLGPAEARDCH